MKFNALMTVALASLMATSAVYAVPTFSKVDDTNSTTMQQMPSDTTTPPATDVAPGPLTDASNPATPAPNVGATPPSNANIPVDGGSTNSMDGAMASNNMDPQNLAATGDSDMSADTSTGDDDY